MPARNNVVGGNTALSNEANGEELVDKGLGGESFSDPTHNQAQSTWFLDFPWEIRIYILNSRKERPDSLCERILPLINACEDVIVSGLVAGMTCSSSLYSVL